MSMTTTSSMSRPSTRAVALLGQATLVLGFALATALAAQVRVPLPFTPVPITLQTMVVVLSGLCLGATGGALSQVLYLALGLCGAPFFAETTGVLALTGVRAGYLLGFVPSAALAGWFMARMRRRHTSLRSWRGLAGLWGSAFVASLPCLFLGAAWLKFAMGVSWPQAWFMGVMPFLLGDVVKTTLAAAIAGLLPQKS